MEALSTTNIRILPQKPTLVSPLWATYQKLEHADFDSALFNQGYQFLIEASTNKTSSLAKTILSMQTFSSFT